MAKAKNKTQKTESSVEDFLNALTDEQQQADSFALVKMMQRATGDKPKMWGATIIGFGNVQLKYESGRVLDWFKIGFSPRKNKLVLYGLNGKEKTEMLKKLGKHKTDGGCIYINKLTDVDADVLKKMMD